ncbi:MAG: glyoxalase [Actinobacteria bacterium]|nr:glyoxalase [Actinomycetota bacterium]
MGDPPSVWAALGFSLEGDRCWVGPVEHRLGAPQPGLSGWAFRGIEAVDVIDGVPSPVEPSAQAKPPVHPNGVVAVDHVVVATPDFERTTGALSSLGLELRRTRETGEHVQGFFLAGPLVLEVVGPKTVTQSGPASLWGVTYVVDDLDATAVFLGDRLRPPRDAVQPGRRIATLDESAGSSVPIAFMTSRP